MAEHPERKVFIFDSLATGPEMMILAEKIRQCEDAGDDFETTKEKVLDYHNHLHTLFCLESMNNLARNGRVNIAVAKIAGMLGIRVAGEAKGGQVAPVHKPRGLRKTTQMLVDMVKERGFRDGGYIRVAHCFAEEAAADFREALLAEFPHARFMLEPTTALCSYYAEVGGLIIGFVTRCMDRLEVNPFFSTIAASFLMALPAYVAAGLGWLDCVAGVIIGALMLLVPGLLITNSMRDIIYGDTSSGVSRIVQVLLSAFAIALGTAAAWRVTSGVYGLTVASGSASYPAWAQAVMIFVACTGFFILFNVHDWGSILCALGGVFTWMTYLLCRDLGMSIYSMNFFAAVVSALYSELMARSRKYPVTSYLVISLLPLVPGAGIYYTMSLGLGGDVQAAVHKGLETAGVAGSIAVAILLVSTIFRLVTAQNGKSRK